jgi:hypothetical protein
MARYEQFEVWVHKDGRWEMVAAFLEFEVANALARARTSRVRLIQATYENGKQVSSDVLAEIGDTRTGY